MTSRLIEMWQMAADDLGLDISCPFMLTLPSGARVNALLLVRNFGARNGMLIFKSYDEIKPYVDELHDSGYGYSVIVEPHSHEEYLREDYVELLKDWGWCGDRNCRVPSWL